MKPPGDPSPAVDRQRLEALFAEALERAGPERSAFLERSCAGDPELRARLRALLEAHRSLESKGSGFLDALDVPRAAELLHEAAPDAEEGAIVGRYRIERRLGQGGMGRVYLARDPALERPVALKLLAPYLSADPAANRRFLEEARAASALDHPHIATVYEIGETDDDRLFIAMAYYEGETLRHRLGRGPLRIRAAVEIAAQVADGLAAAHAKGIIHRDVKPENLVFGPRGAIKILDFGVAKVASAALTRSGATLGTVAYMAPEQTRGGPVDPRADLWSLGVVLYEMLTGRRPFAGETNDAVIYGIRHDAPEPVSALRPEIPTALARVVECCLGKDPDHRFASAEELRDALRSVLQGALRDADAADAQAAAAPAGVASLAGWTAAYLLATVLAFLLVGELAPRYLLPAWVPNGVLVLALLGLPVVLATARRHRPGAGGRSSLLTWPRAIAGGLAAFAALTLVSGFIVVEGLPRVTQARGAAGDAFGERGWVVVADFEATADAGDVVLAAREALTVDLQQSGFVNVLSRAQVSGVLRQMGLPDTARLDLPLALEVAERAGAGAVLTATVSRLGPQYVLSGRAVRPGSGEELFAVRTAAGPDRLLGAVEALSREMRRRLGEEREAIRESRPLPAVSTASLEALRFYAQADRSLMADDERAARLAAEAIRLDPAFAMAHRLAGVLAHNQLRFGDATHHLTRAFELRDRLTERERRHVEAIYHQVVSLQPRHAADAYELLLQRHPDDWRAAHNLGSLLMSWLDDQAGAYTQLMRAAELAPEGAGALLRATHAAFFLGRLGEADSLARLAEQRGFGGFDTRWRMARAFATGDARRAAALCDSLLGGAAGTVQDDDREFCGSVKVASGRLRQGITSFEALERSYLRTRRFRNVAHAAQGLAVAHQLRGEPREAAARIQQVLDRVPADAVPEPDRYISRTNLQVQAALLGRPDLVERIGAAYPPYADPEHWFGRTGDALVDAARAVNAGDGAAALRVLRAGWRTDLDAIGWRIWNDLLRGMAFEQLARPDSAAVHYGRAADARYLTLPMVTKHRIYLPIALQRLAAAEESRGNADGAALAYRRLLELWADADPELHGEVAAIRAALARLDADD